MSGSLEPSARVGDRVFIVNSWPVLEWAYRNEPVTTYFRQRLDAAVRGEIRLLISRINLGEIRYNFFIKKRRGELPNIDLDLASLPLEVQPVDDRLVDEAADLKSIYPISYADCFVAALAIRHDVPVITGDPDFRRLAATGVVRVDWMGA